MGICKRHMARIDVCPGKWHVSLKRLFLHPGQVSSASSTSVWHLVLECGLVFQKMLSSGHLPAQWQNVGRTLRRVVKNCIISSRSHFTSSYPPDCRVYMAYWKQRLWHCQCCWAHRPASWRICICCRRWVGLGCRPEHCWIAPLGMCRSCTYELLSGQVGQAADLVMSFLS